MSEIKVNSDFGEGNVAVGDDGKWKMPFLTTQYAPGVHYFKLTGYKIGTAIHTEISFSFTILPAQLPAAPTGMKCVVDGHATETNTYVNYGQIAECSVMTSDPNTRAMLSAGRTSWGDITTTKQVENRGDTVVPGGSYLNGVYTVKIVGDYHGYSLSRELWFENSAGKTSLLSIGMSDPDSADYAQAEAYLDKQRIGSDKHSVQTTTTTAATNPFRSKFSADFAGRIDQLVVRILARGKTLSADAYVTYLTNLSSGIKSLALKSAYSGDEEVANIAGYLIYELDAVK
ncbi:MAG: hypothetical protein ACOYN2_04755 [Patescibacteria group bacterium]